MKPIKSSVLDKSKAQLAGLKSIDAALDLGHGLDVVSHEKELLELDNEISALNTLSATFAARMKALRANIKVHNEKGLRRSSAVVAKYGKESEEYVKIGGKRPSQRKRFTPSGKIKNPPKPPA